MLEKGGEGGVARGKVSSHILEASLLQAGGMEGEGRFSCTSGLLEQKVLEHGLLGVPLAEVLALSGPGFLCEVPVLHLRFRLLSPSPSKPLVCRPVSGVAPEASGPGHAVGG